MRDRDRGPAQIKSMHQNARDNTVANARPIWPWRPRNRDNDRHQPDHQSHPDREIGGAPKKADGDQSEVRLDSRVAAQVSE